MYEHLSLLKKISRETSDYIRENIENEGIDKIVMMGAYNSPTTKIDYDAENFAIDLIKNEVDWNILTEERGFIDNKSDYTVVMDPLDGTYNALNAIPFYSFSIALYHRNKCKVGVVINIPTGDEYYAVKGKGAYKNGNKIKVKPLKKPYLFVVSLGESSSIRARKIVNKARRIRSMGCASLEMIMVAQGSADLFLYDHTPKKLLRIVDIAASSLILREAGGRVVDLENNDLNMPLKVGVKENIMAYGDERVLEVIK